MKYERLSPEDERAFIESLDSIWSAIGYDCLAAVAEEKGIKPKRTNDFTLVPAEQVTLSRRTVIDIVTDNFAGRSPYAQLPDDQFDRIREWMLNTPGHIVDKVIASSDEFSFKRYGA